MKKLARAKLELKSCIYSIGKREMQWGWYGLIHDENCEEAVFGVQGLSLHVSPKEKICCFAGIKSKNNSSHIAGLLVQEI